MGDGAPDELLVVDDEPLNRDLLKRVLSGYEVVEAGDADEALRVLEDQRGEVRVVLCDQLMPGRSGVELAVEVAERWPGIVFLLLTGYDDDPEVRDARHRGVVERVVAKPWRAKALRKTITAALAGAE